jgi:Zn finger protein HypA/HybF involved in hydrogenase expression
MENLNLDLSDEEFDIECPECERTLEVTLSKMGKTIVCPNCKTNINLIDKGLGEAVKDASKQIDDLLKELNL